MSSRKRQRLVIRMEDDFAIVSLEDMEIWDGADLALLREAMTGLIEQEGARCLGVDLSTVKYIPSGFFGMLFEWYDAGVRIRLYSPQDNVSQMLWFRMFFAHDGNDTYRLSDESVRNNSPGEQVEYHRRCFSGTGSSPENDEDVMAIIKAVRFGVRAPQSFRQESVNP